MAEAIPTTSTRHGLELRLRAVEEGATQVSACPLTDRSSVAVFEDVQLTCTGRLTVRSSDQAGITPTKERGDLTP
jgi:hypothetical protein